MSPKNNIFFNVYLDTKNLMNIVISLEIYRVETDNMNSEIFALRESIRLQREAEEALKLQLKETVTNLEDINIPEITTENTQTINELKITTESSTEVFGDTPADDSNLLDVEEQITEESIQAIYKEKIESLRKLRTKDLFTKYSSLFGDFNFESNIQELVSNRVLEDTILSGKQPKIDELTKKYSVLYNFATSSNSNKFPISVLFFLRLRGSSFHLFEKFFKFKLNKTKFKKKRKLKKIRTLRKIKKIILFKKNKKKFIFNRHHTLNLAVNSIKTNCNILVKRMPITQRVIETTNVELFYKHSKDTKAELAQGALVYASQNLGNDEDLLIYLRNYHQKPYLKLRKARVAH